MKNRYLEIVDKFNPDPDFTNMLAVLNKSRPNRCTLFELFLNESLYRLLSDDEFSTQSWQFGQCSQLVISAFKNAGYDYTTVLGTDMYFKAIQTGSETSRNTVTISLNADTLLKDHRSVKQYPWPDPKDYDFGRLKEAENLLPTGMKLIVHGPGGVLENAISLTGYDNLSMMLFDDPNLVKDIFANIGERLVEYYRICCKYDTVGACISNDDWGFKTQTMFSPEDMRKYVFPWHKKIVETIHAAGKPAILHSCGKFCDVVEDIIDYIGYDARHSYEDSIIPVEQAYLEWGQRIAILGGLDIDYLCTQKPQEVYHRAKEMLKLSSQKGSYALGTGNSVPDYVPNENYFAMISAVLKERL